MWRTILDAWNIDSHKLLYHPARVAQWLEADTWDKAKTLYPLYWEVTTSAACNHRCTFCSVDAIGYPNIMFPSDILIARIREAAKLGVKSVMFAGTGEPLLHKDINWITIASRDAGLDVAFTTNAIALHKFEAVDHCTWIKVSLNAGTRESYARIHRTSEKDWDRVWSNISDAVQRKGECTIGVQCVVLPENVHDMKALARHCIDAGVDYLVLKPYSQATFMLSHQYEGIDYSRMDSELRSVLDYNTDKFAVIYRTDSFKQESEAHHYSKCHATPNFWTYSMANGDMFSCSAHLLDRRFCIGNLYKQSFQEIWEGEGRRGNWELMKEFDISQCRLNCRMDKPNRYLDRFSKQEHINFI